MRKIGIFLSIVALAMSVLCFGGCSSEEQYKPELPDPSVSKPVIGENGVLRVGVNTDRSPLAGLGNDKIIGIDVDIAAAMADELGLKLQILDVGSDAAGAIADDEVDLVLGIDKAETQSDFWVSEEYLPTAVSLFALTSRNAPVPTTTSMPEIAAQASSKSAWAVSNIFGDESLISTVDLATAFNELSTGEVEYVASDAIIGLYAANRQGIDVSIIALLEPANGYGAGVSMENVELQGIVKDVLAKLKANGTIDVIEKKWLGKEVDFSNISVVEGRMVSTESPDDEGDLDDEEGAADATGADATTNTAATTSTGNVASSGGTTTSNTATSQ